MQVEQMAEVRGVSPGLTLRPSLSAEWRTRAESRARECADGLARRAGPRPDREKTRSARPNTIGLTSRQRGSRGGRENMAARGRLVSTGLRAMLFR